jgi:hypothetical protein
MKRLHDVAVRMRPRVPRNLDGAPQSASDTEQPSDPETDRPPAETPRAGFASTGEGPRIPARSPFMPSSRDLARAAAQAAAEEDNDKRPRRRKPQPARRTRPENRQGSRRRGAR